MARALSSSPTLYRLPFGHFSESDKPNAALRAKILARDGNRCFEEECKICMPRHMEVRHLDDDHDNMAESNLVCVCPFCHLRDHLGPTGFASAGMMIGSTTLTQGQINSLALTIWYVQARIEKKQDIRSMVGELSAETDEGWRQSLLSTVTSLWNDLTTKSVRWAGAYSPLATEPDIFGSVLNDLFINQPKVYADRGLILKGLHVLPLKEAFEVQCKDWFALLDRTRPIGSWKTGLSSLMGKMNTTPEQLFDDMRKNFRDANRVKPDGVGRPLGSQAGDAPAAAVSNTGTPPKRYD